MGAENAVTKRYLSDPERFAEVFNNEVFQGNQVIQAQRLRELDPGEMTEIVETHKELRFLERYRDCVKIHDQKVVLVILGIENQQAVDYSMPIRGLLYDALNYENQRKAIMKEHEKQQDLSGDEYLGKFGKKDKIFPVISLTVYWGSRPWDGATSLHELLDISNDLSQYKDRIADYRMNLFEVNRMTNLERYGGNLKALLGFVKYQRDKDALLGFVDENEQVFRQLDTETSQAIRVLANAKELESILMKQEVEMEEIDMCQALQEWKAEILTEGLEKGIEQGIEALILDNLEEGKSREQIILKLEKRFSLSEEMANSYYERVAK